VANSADVNAGDDILASQYNNLRKDVLDLATGHDHNGVGSRTVNAIDSDTVDSKHAADLKHGISTDDQTAIKVKIGFFPCPGPVGQYSISTIGFKPRYVEFKAVRSIIGSAQTGFGWMDYNGNQGAWASTVVHPDQATYYRNDFCLIAIDQYQNWEIGASFVSMNSNGFTINFEYTNTGFYILYKAVR